MQRFVGPAGICSQATIEAEGWRTSAVRRLFRFQKKRSCGHVLKNCDLLVAQELATLRLLQALSEAERPARGRNPQAGRANQRIFREEY
jgi:hypothetical protein